MFAVTLDLGPEFVFEALRTDPVASGLAKGRTLRFLANVDPVDVARALAGLNPELTLVIIVSKTFTTAETMLNARTVKNWLLTSLPDASPTDVIRQHMIAVRLGSCLPTKNACYAFEHYSLDSSQLHMSHFIPILNLCDSYFHVFSFHLQMPQHRYPQGGGLRHQRGKYIRILVGHSLIWMLLVIIRSIHVLTQTHFPS